jgi:hypothetical protein
MQTYRITFDLPQNKVIQGKIMAENVPEAVAKFYEMAGNEATAQGLEIAQPVGVRCLAISMKTLAVKFTERAPRARKAAPVAAVAAKKVAKK